MLENGAGHRSRGIFGAACSLWDSTPSHEVGGPWTARAKTAVLQPWFRVRGRVKVFQTISPDEIGRYRPQAMAGPLEVLRELARLALHEELRLAGLDFGIIAFTGIGRPALGPDDRDLFWRAFQTPVFQQLRAETGDLLAAECQARQGLHIESGAAVFQVLPAPGSELLVGTRSNGDESAELLPTGFHAEISHLPCPCGLPGSRLTGLRTLRKPVAAAGPIKTRRIPVSASML